MPQVLEKQNYSEPKSKDMQTGDRIRVMIVDTHTLMRKALQRIVSMLPQVQVCASLGSFENATTIAWETQAQVVIVSGLIPVSTCIDLVEMLLQSQAPIGIVVIQYALNPEVTMTLLKHGVQSLLGEEASEEDLAKAIAAAAAGGTFLDRRVREILESMVSRTPIHFTRREVEVLSWLKRGVSNYQIANALSVSEKTVEKHLTHIYEKLHARSRSEAIWQTQHMRI